MKLLRDCRLYTFLDTAYLRDRSLETVAQQLCDGGSDLIQLRAKNSPPAQILAMAERVLPILETAGVGLVINDHPEIAATVGAPFCHLGQEDFLDRGYGTVDQLCAGLSLKGNCYAAPLQIGISTHAPAQAQRALLAGAAYIAIGPVFATPTKPQAQPVSLDYVRWAAANVSAPWFAIGGISLANLDAVLEAGASRVCAVSAILCASDPAHACLQFKERLLSARRD